MINDFAETILVCVIVAILFIVGLGLGYSHGNRDHHKNTYDAKGNLTCEICKELKERGSK